MMIPAMTTERHNRWMQQTLDLAREGLGLTRPNPPVAAMVVKNHRLLGQGFHKKAGGAHAEIHALKEAGAAAKGAAIYVSLEPCSSRGRTPPCVEAILAAGIKEVYVSANDPNPKHAGRGLDLLRESGIYVHPGILEAAGRDLIRPWRSFITLGRPHVTLKLAMSLDGRIADFRKKSQWITGPAARELTQALRREVDAIMVGANTARLDNPSLLPRPSRGRNPYRVIVTREGRLPKSLKVLNDAKSKQTIVASTSGKKGTLAYRNLKGLMKKLAERDITHLLCEGGGELAGSLVKQGLVDDFVFFVAPTLLGDRGRPGIAGVRWDLDSKPQLEIVSSEAVGRDLMIRARNAD
jgi:diaminohydroxyphosphoribosylaminopyrimidine deaminase/5-amino-6-(5-phosphoribosylamino)uracil reductase